FFFQAEDGIRDRNVTGVQTCALPISLTRISSFPGEGSGKSSYLGTPPTWCSTAPFIFIPPLTPLNLTVLSKFIRSEEHTSELQSRFDSVCRLLLEKTKDY